MNKCYNKYGFGARDVKPQNMRNGACDPDATTNALLEYLKKDSKIGSKRSNNEPRQGKSNEVDPNKHWEDRITPIKG